jgi:Fis family transcriptional regulator
VARPSTKKQPTKRKKRKKSTAALAISVKDRPLSTLTDDALRSYLTSLNGHKPAELYKLVMGEVEKPLFKTVMEYAGGNQCRAAEILGINRGTLRKKLIAYKLLDA